MEKNKKHETEQTRSTPRFGVMDVVIILLVITAVVGIYFRYNILDILRNDRDMKDYTVSFSIEDIRYSTPDYVQVDDAVYFSDDGTKMGTVMESSQGSARALSERPAVKVFLTEDGLMERVSYPNNESRVDATGRLLCRGSYSEDGGFLINGTRYVSAGQSLQVQTETVTVTITVTDIRLAE